MAGPDYDTQIKQLSATMSTIEQVLDPEAMRREIGELQEQVSAPDLWNDQANATRVTGRLNTLQNDLERASSLRKRLEDLPVMFELAEEEGDADTRAEAEAELAKVGKDIEYARRCPATTTPARRW